ncbi:DNA-methyltransferase [Xanthobacter sp. TB0136]|uniref:DNA-methyltransferase n=1 Tax=Xanthobacter sp. TB0136 TaxID=3459177 RepID=UPI0040391C11
MTPEALLSGWVRLWLGDVRAALEAMPPDSVDCVVTSPPYWGLRDYGVEGQIGLEPTLFEHLSVMVEVFNLVRRVLRPTGTLWLNYGDCYATAPNGRSASDAKSAGGDDRTFRDKPLSTIGGTLKPKDLCMIPNRLAIALQDAGWWVRSEIIWGKTNPMPDSSGAYRPSSAHEKIFLLTKSDSADVWRARDTGEISFAPDLSERCPLITSPDRDGPRWMRMGAYYDAEEVRQGHYSGDAHKMPDGWDTGPGRHGSIHRAGREKGIIRGREAYGRHTHSAVLPEGERRDKQRGHSRRHQGFNERWDAMGRDEQRANGRYLRNYEPAPLNVWRMGTKPFSGAHFATFPPELALRCIAAGCPPGGLVLDPFGGAGTTALAALRLGRLAALIELNPEYAAIARARLEADWAGAIARAARTAAPSDTARPLFGGKAAE